MMEFSRLGRRAVLALAIALLAFAATPASAEKLDDVLSRFDEVQHSIETLRAKFTETTSNQLLKEPIVASGMFYMSKPDAIRWDYASPEAMSFVIANDQYTGFYPEQNRAEQRSVKRWSERIFRFIGLGQGSDELKKFYDIRLEETGADSSLYHLVLDPKKKRVRRLVDEVHFWVDSTSFLPRRVEYLTETGSRIIEFETIDLNPELDPSLYVVEIPEGVEIGKGFGGLPGLGSAQGDTR